MNSGPLSERMCSGPPRRMNGSDKTSITSVDFSLRLTRMARHSWVELVHDVEGAELAAVVGPLLDDVAGPHVIPVLGPEPDAGAVAEPKPPAFRLPGRHLRPFLAPDPVMVSLSNHPRACR